MIYAIFSLCTSNSILSISTKCAKITDNACCGNILMLFLFGIIINGYSDSVSFKLNLNKCFWTNNINSTSVSSIFLPIIRFILYITFNGSFANCFNINAFCPRSTITDLFISQLKYIAVGIQYSRLYLSLLLLLYSIFKKTKIFQQT